MMRKIRGLLCAALGVVSGTAVLAQESGGTSGGNFEINTERAGQAADAIGDAISNLISGKVADNVMAIIGAGLLIFAIFVVVRWAIRGGKTAAK